MSPNVQQHCGALPAFDNIFYKNSSFSSYTNESAHRRNLSTILLEGHNSLYTTNANKEFPSTLNLTNFHRSFMRPPNSDFIKVLRIKGANGEERILQFPIKLDLERPKRPRTIFSDYQLRILEEAFKKNDYLTGEDRLALAIRLGLSDTQVKVWFQNRRTKNRKKLVNEEKRMITSSPGAEFLPNTISVETQLHCPRYNYLQNMESNALHPFSTASISQHIPFFQDI